MMRQGFMMSCKPPCSNDELEKLLTSLSYREICQELNAVVDGDSVGVMDEQPFPLCPKIVSNGQTQNVNRQQIREADTTESKKELAMTNDKRKRTLFTPYQLTRLEEEFRQNMYVVGLKRWRLATELCLTEKQVKIWFQNRRMKLKREHVKIKCLSNGFPWY